LDKKLNIVLSGGGTGGHIFPAIAIANEIKSRFPNANILFVGAKDRMEMEKVPQNGYEIKGLWISGLQRKLSLKNLSFPFKLISSLYNANKIIRKFKPDVVIGTGGFASGPTLYMAALKGIPTLIQEQNSYAGITNKLLAKKVDTICVAYDGLAKFFPKEKIVFTGNPIRQDLISQDTTREEALAFFKLDKTKKTVLVLGGSLGARAVNEIIANTVSDFKEHNVQVIWQTGKLYIDKYKKYNEGLIQTHAFLNRMDLAYQAADVIISRAGASSISELCVVAKPVVLIPSPNVAEDHQTKNAMAIASKDAGILLKEKDLKTTFKNILFDLLDDEEKQEVLRKNIKALAKPNATKTIVDKIEKLLK
jgi:UDP-N-acetylglucosamine--N-acetylmuramyl-(pentapeptide) pyrophosphoryl-undecaprenol N-acetylglucosamine transferase